MNMTTGAVSSARLRGERRPSLLRAHDLMFATDETIVAIATPPGRGAVGIVRLSGPDAARIASAMIDRPGPLQARHATLARFAPAGATADAPPRNEIGRAIDRVLVTHFPAPHSYTGQDIVEISGHGSPVLLDHIVACAMRHGARLAQSGEFTLRAFLGGRLDLVQAEAVADLVESITPEQARQAFDQLEGTLTRAIGDIERGLFDLVARLEASVDFPDEGYHFVAPGEAAEKVGALIRQIDALLAHAKQGRLIREGGHAAIVGRANTGKSSLFNYLSGSDRAIVTAHPGTTRDLVTERVDINGIPVTLVDTAGLRAVTDEVEREGVARARQARAFAQVAIVVLDRSVPLHAADFDLLRETARTPRAVVVNKCDLPAAWDSGQLGVESPVEVSLLTGAGAEALRPALARAFVTTELQRDTPTISNIRHIELLARARAALTEASARAVDATPEEFVLADLQQARGALEEITGRRTSADVLTHIFARFCIGK